MKKLRQDMGEDRPHPHNQSQIREESDEQKNSNSDFDDIIDSRSLNSEQKLERAIHEE